VKQPATGDELIRRLQTTTLDVRVLRPDFNGALCVISAVEALELVSRGGYEGGGGRDRIRWIRLIAAVPPVVLPPIRERRYLAKVKPAAQTPKSTPSGFIPAHELMAGRLASRSVR